MIKFLIFCVVILFCTTLTTSATNDDESVLKLETEAKQFAEHITHCQFTFGPLTFNSSEIQSPQKRWEKTRQVATSNMASCEVPVDYRISTPDAAAIQPNFSLFYVDNTTTVPKDFLTYLPENILAANDPGLSEEQLIIVLKKIFRSKMSTTLLLNGTEQTKRSLPFLKRELRLMKHRFYLFRLMSNFKAEPERTFDFMPGFIGYYKDVAKKMLDLYKDLDNQTLIDAVIYGEHLLDQINSQSSASLHGNLLGADGKEVIYFVIQSWDKSLPECADDSLAHVMIKNGNAMERTAPTCRPKWPITNNALYESEIHL
uniref:Uncharacterized protein n=1 Tax=Globodera rostochiensis TaxID=31243 RepID=A0A914H482_GLORO